MVLDTDAYVEAVGATASDDAVQRAVAREVSASLDPRIPPAQREQIEAVVEQTVGSARFRSLWERANREVHGDLVAVLRDDGEAAVLDLEPVVESVARRLRASGLVVEDPTPGLAQVEILRADARIDRARGAVSALDRLALVLPLVALVLLGAGVVLAPRRGPALRRTGIGLVLVAIAVGVGALAARAATLDALSATSEKDVGAAIFAALAAPLYLAVLVLGAVALVVAAIGAVVALRES